MATISHEVSTAINWLDDEQMVQLIENAGFACNADDSDAINLEFRELVESGDIDLSSFMD